MRKGRFNKYPYSTIQDKEIYHCSEEEISELKKELIPLLEKIEAEGKIFVNPYYYFHHYTPEKGVGGKNFVKILLQSEWYFDEIV